MAEDIDRLRARLEARLRELSDELAAGTQATRVVELDQASVGRLSRMDAIQMQAMAQAAQQRRRGELRRVQAALDRLKEGEYGYCESCGEEIALARLELDPAARTCVRCASHS